MQSWTIGEVAARSGVPASTIRYYEEIELLPPALRVNGRRRYDNTILPTLRVIRLAQQAGFSIAEIQTLLHDFPVDTLPSTRWQGLARRKLSELDERMQQLQVMKSFLEQTLDCQCRSLEECAARGYKEMG
jgi:MerR family redox-sensitive transcriptional activator SoxR